MFYSMGHIRTFFVVLLITFSAPLILIFTASAVLSDELTGNGNGNCNTFEDTVSNLATAWGESLVFAAISRSGALVTLFLNENTGTWTVLHTNPGELTCHAVDGVDGQLYDIDPIGDNT